MSTKHNRMCVLKCTDKKLLHGFPKDEISRNVWLKQLGIKRATTSAFVCDRHFSQKMKPNGVGIKLTPCAIPDINLPEPGDIIDSDEEEEEAVAGEEEEEEEEQYDEEDGEQCFEYEGSDTQMNGFSENGDNDEDGARGEEDLDFDVLLAKVHCISDFIKNKKPDNNITINDNESEILEEEEEFNDHSSMSSSYDELDDGPTFEELNLSTPLTIADISNKTKRKLILHVRRSRLLYDPLHPSFSNIEKKTRAWRRIGKTIKFSGTACRELWLKMRYDYQSHVRKLRQWLAGESTLRERPRIPLEDDLLFLWRYIPDKSYCDDSDDEFSQTYANASQGNGFPNVPMSSSRDCTVVANEYARVVDHAYANKKNNESIPFPSNLIEAVKYYPELYDPQHPNYGDCKRKTIIWEAISNELDEKTTRCLFTWIHLQLRYEFEIIHNKSSFLLNKMEFLKKHILTNPKSPFKRITSLSNEWYDPMNSYKEQHMILQTMVSTKKFRPYFMNIDVIPLAKDVPIPCWIAFGRSIQRKPEQCEVTWVVMQAMYLEITELRRNDCPLRDTWQFEDIINNLRATITVTSKKAARDHMLSQALPDVTPIAEPPEIVQPPPPPPVEVKNEITFRIPGQPTESGAPVEQLVRFKLDTPIPDLPIKSIVEIDSVLPNAHIVLLAQYKGPPNVYLFTVQKRKEFIAEVMARPIVFSGPCKFARLARVYWSEISLEMGYPAEICMFFWDYVLEKNFFVDYDPSWKKNMETKWIPPPNPIFEKFQKYADLKDWGEYISVLPDFVQEIGNFPLIYNDLKINSSWNRRQCHNRDVAEVWSIMARKFAVLEGHKVIWDKLKALFLLYMSEIEISIYNPWPKFWFPVLEKMTYLCDFKYSPKDPIYYVIKHKIKDEITEYYRDGNPKPPKLDPVTNATAIFRMLKETEYLGDFTWVNRARFLSKMKTFPALYDVSNPLFGNKEAKLEAWQEMALTFHCTVTECQLIFQHLMKGFLLFRARDPHQICRVNAKYWENMTYIYSCAVPNAIDPKLMEGRSFRAASTGSTIKLAEEYQAEISLVDAKARLVLKNFAAAVNSVPIQIHSSVMQQIKYIFAEYARVQNEEIVVDV